MNKQKELITNLESLMDMLASKDGMIRQKARKSLVDMGKSAVSSLIFALENSKLDKVRWEAAKALGEIVDVRSIPVLIKSLEDSDHDVIWLAAKALSKFKKSAWPLLLQALIKDESDSVILRQGVHHVFLHQREEGFNDLLETLMKALESGSVVRESTKETALNILKRMEIKL